MKITKAEYWKESIPLTRPYEIAYRSMDTIDIMYIMLELSNGLVGYGAASPAEFVTGESYEKCQKALQDNLEELTLGRDIRHALDTCRNIQNQLENTPAACAGVEMAILDLFGKYLDIPLVKFFGQRHKSFATSVTIGIKSLEESIEEAIEYKSRGFRIVKLKVGKDIDKDIEITRKIREKVGRDLLIRVDANQGYTIDEYQHYLEQTKDIGLEFVEQPLPVTKNHLMLELDQSVIGLTAGDESIQKPADALMHANYPKTFGIYNIKLMKCGGITAARLIADIAHLGGIDLMWGCMDESCLSIAAALHASLASERTKYLDLDGSFDLAKDIFNGGFVLENGHMTVNKLPGLGATLKKI